MNNSFNQQNGSNDISRKLRPDGIKTLPCKKSYGGESVPISPAVRRYAFEKGLSIDELAGINFRGKIVTKYDIDRYIEKKRIFAKQQIKSKMISDVDKAAMEKALYDIDNKVSINNTESTFRDDLDDSEERINSEKALDSQEISLNRIQPESPQNTINISPLAKAMAEIEGISLESIGVGSGKNGQIISSDIQKMINEKQISNSINVSELAQKMAFSNGIDLELLKPGSGLNGQIIAMDVYLWEKSHQNETESELCSDSEIDLLPQDQFDNNPNSIVSDEAEDKKTKDTIHAEEQINAFKNNSIWINSFDTIITKIKLETIAFVLDDLVQKGFISANEAKKEFDYIKEFCNITAIN